MFWKDSYLVGHEQIDRQHKQLFNSVEKLMNGLKQADNREDYKSYLKETIAFLKDYTLNHFKYEETYAVSLGINYDEHRKLHGALIRDVFHFEKLLTDTDFSNPTVKSFLGFIITWLTYHVGEEDVWLKSGQITKSDVCKNTPTAGAINQGDFLLTKFAEKVRDVIRVMTGLADKDITLYPHHDSPLKAEVSYRVGLIGEIKKAIGFNYSKDIALGAFKAMTEMEINEINEMIYSALQELSNILSSRLSGIITSSGIECDIEIPELVKQETIPFANNRFLILTKLGNMEVVLLDK